VDAFEPEHVAVPAFGALLVANGERDVVETLRPDARHRTANATPGAAIGCGPGALVQWPSRAGSALRPPPRPLRVLDPGRGVPDPEARRAGRRAGDAGGRAQRPRLARRRRRALPGDPEAGRQAAHRL